MNIDSQNPQDTQNADVPLIYTSRGNLPIADLDYSTHWQFDARGITFVEEYFLGEECVKRSAHRFQYAPEKVQKIIAGDFNA